MRGPSIAVLLVAFLAAGPASVGGLGAASVAASAVSSLHVPHAAVAAAVPAGQPFAFVSNFEDHALDGWHATNGTVSVVATPDYDGEPSLASTKGTTFQTDIATRNFSLGDTFLSFQADIFYAAGGVGFVGLFGPGGGEVAIVGVNGSGGVVFAGSSLHSKTNISTIPTGTAQPAGWVSLLVNVYATGTGNATAWVMDVYVDRTDVAAATGISVPAAGSYRGGIIETVCNTLYYTNLVYTTYEIPTTIKGYNNMDGYGQGSGLLVQALPKYTELSASMLLDNWTIPQTGILSFQINAMNRVGTFKNTCTGFYQLGVDLNPGGYIAPWFVPNNNCVAYYFNSNNTPRLSPGFATPAGSRLSLKIVDNPAAKTITFQITDLAVRGTNHTVTATIPYNGTPFYGAYTQVEWQPCCSKSPISSYFFNGTLYHLMISGGNLTAPYSLPATYMLPFALDVPPSWCFTYYDQGIAGYDQVA